MWTRGTTLTIEEPQVSEDGRTLALTCAVDGRSFTETITLPDVPAVRPADEAFARIARLLGCAVSLSYYKAYAPGRVVLPALTLAEREWFASLVRHGLAEFAYRNDLPEALTPELDGPLRADAPVDVAPAVDPTGCLVAVGGGKDSVVTIESLKAAGADVTLFSVNSYAPIEACAEVAERPLVSARRVLDPQLRELNAAGAWNGHVPVTAINSLVAALTAYRSGLAYVVFSNERSSSYGNLVWQGFDVNHQWSKGLGFERSTAALLAPLGVGYVSLLRPLSEISIMRAFADHTAYREVFTSCNRAFHLDPALRTSWCGHCPKCRFVHLMLAPFVGPDELFAIFGADLFADRAQLPEFLDLLGVGPNHKPFECVGEPEECAVALSMLREDPRWRDHPFLAEPEIAAVQVDDVVAARVFAFSDEHQLPAWLEKVARAVL